MRGLLTHLVGVVIFIFILTRINISDAARIILNANLFFFLLSVALLIPMLLLEGLRWHYILRRLGIMYGFRSSFTMFASSLFIGSVTPARIGEFVRVTFIREHGFGKSFFSVFIDRVADVLFLTGAGYIGMFFFAVALEQQIFWLSIAILVLVAFVAVMLVRRDFVRTVLRLVFHRIVPERMKTDLKTAFYEFYRSFLSMLDPWPVFVVFSLTFLSWMVYYAMVYFLALSLGLKISFIHLATIVSIASLLSVLPLSISGIGTRDAALVFFFSLIGIRSEFAIALSALILVNMVLSSVICFPFWLRKPARLSF